MIWKIRNRELSLAHPLLMGILNITPDSFSDGGEFFDREKATQRALQMVEEGADILDLGGESTRLGAEPVPADEEIHRVLPVLRQIREHSDIPVSVDTTKSEVAKACLEAGADIINDVSALRESGRKMAAVVCEFGAGLVLMHRRGNAATMQSLANYDDVIAEVIEELDVSISLALDCGVKRDQMVIDPGLGFAKTTGHNIEVLRRIEEFHALGFPILVGPSRKKFLGDITGKEVADREFATSAVVAMGVVKGVQIFRVHDVKSMRAVIQITEKICKDGDRYVRTFEMGQY